MADNLSNVPPVVTLSGIPGSASFSGAGQSDLSGTGSQSPFAPGMQPGMDLLQMLLQQGGGDAASSAAGLGLGQSLSLPSFSQGGGMGGGFGGLGAAGGMVAGQTAAEGGAGGGIGGASSSLDPASLIARILGIGSKLAGFAGASQTASPTQGGNTLSDQLRGQDLGTGASFTASPTAPGADQSALANLGNAPLNLGGATTPDAFVSQLYQNLAQFPNAGLFNPATGGAPFTSLQDFSPEALQSFLGQLTDPNVGLTNLSIPGGTGEAGSGLLNSGSGSSSLSGADAAAGAGGSSALGNASALGNLVGPILGLIAQLTGNQDLATAARAAGVGGNALSILGTASNLSSLAPLLGTATAAAPTGAASALGSGAASGLAAGGTAGLGTAVGAAALPIAVMSLFWGIGNMISPGSYPDFSDIWTGGKPDSYLTFDKRLSQNEQRQGQGLGLLSQALPYAQSQQDLQNILAEYKKYIPLGNEGLAPFMSPDPYTLSAIPGVGEQTHGMATSPVDWGPQVQRGQSLIDYLRGSLPETSPTALDAGGLWNQIAQNASNQQHISQGLDLSSLPYLSPYDQAQTLQAYQQGTPITAPVSSAFRSLFPNYQPMPLTQLPAVDPGLMAQVQADQAQVAAIEQAIREAAFTSGGG